MKLRYLALLLFTPLLLAQTGPSYDGGPFIVGGVSPTGGPPYFSLTTSGTSGPSFDGGPFYRLGGYNATTGLYYVCGTNNPCTGSGGGGGGATTFDQIGSGTNIGQGLVVGAGSVLSPSGGGFINANEINGTLLSGLASCLLFNTTGTGVPLCANSAQVIAGFGTQAANTVFGNFTGSTAVPTFSATPVFSAANLTNFPTFNQNTTGTAANVTGTVAIANGGTGAATAAANTVFGNTTGSTAAPSFTNAPSVTSITASTMTDSGLTGTAAFVASTSGALSNPNGFSYFMSGTNGANSNCLDIQGPSTPLPLMLCAIVNNQLATALNSFFNGTNWVYSNNGTAGSFRILNNASISAAEFEINLNTVGTAAGTITTHDTSDVSLDCRHNNGCFINPNSQGSSLTFGTNTMLAVNPVRTIDNLASAQITTTATTNKGLVLQMTASQTANALEVQSSTGTVLASVGPTGTVTAPAFISTLGQGTVTATPSAGVTSFTCATATCDVSGGTYTVVGGTATTGTFATLAWPTTTTAWRCTAVMNGGGTGASFLGIGHSVATATGMTVSAALTILGNTFSFDYSCQP